MLLKGQGAAGYVGLGGSSLAKTLTCTMASAFFLVWLPWLRTLFGSVCMPADCNSIPLHHVEGMSTCSDRQSSAGREVWEGEGTMGGCVDQRNQGKAEAFPSPLYFAPIHIQIPPLPFQSNQKNAGITQGPGESWRSGEGRVAPLLACTVISLRGRKAAGGKRLTRGSAGVKRGGGMVGRCARVARNFRGSKVWQDGDVGGLSCRAAD